jgi:hypothetical protein
MSALKLYKQSKSQRNKFEYAHAKETLSVLINDFPDSIYAEQAETDIFEIDEQVEKGIRKSFFAMSSSFLAGICFWLTLSIFTGQGKRGEVQVALSDLNLKWLLVLGVITLVIGVFSFIRVNKYYKFLSGKQFSIIGILSGVSVIFLCLFQLFL